MTGLDFDRFDALTFDCYGTLIDWEAGILAGLRPVLGAARGRRGRRRAARGLRRAARRPAEAGPYRALPRHPRRRPARGGGAATASSRTPAEVDGVRRIRSATGRRSPIRRRRSRALHDAVPARRHHQLRRRPVRPVGGAARRRRSTGSSPPQQAGAYKPDRAQLRARASSGSGCRASGSCTSPRACSTTTCRRSASGFSDGLDRSPARPAGVRRDAARRRDARRDLPGHGLVRRGRCAWDRHGRGRQPAVAAAVKCGSSVAQPPWLRSRQSSPSAPRRSQPRCSISTRVVASPLVDEADLDLGRVGAVAAEVPQVDEPAAAAPRPSPRPSRARCRRGVRSKIRPPGRGSRTTVRSGSPVTVWSAGHHCAIRRGPDLEGVVGAGSRPRRRAGSARSPVRASCSRPRAGTGRPPRPRPARDRRGPRRRPRRGGGRCAASRAAPRRRARPP